MNMFSINVKCVAECKTMQGNIRLTRCRHNKGKAALATVDKAAVGCILQLPLQHHPPVQSGMAGLCAV